MVTTLLLCVVLGQSPSAPVVQETLGAVETVWIPSYNSYCKGQKILTGDPALVGWYRILEVLQQQPIVQSNGYDPYGFLGWLNSVRASYGLSAVGYDQNLSNWAAMNNNQQHARGLGHFIMGPARRQNAAMTGGFPGGMWMASAGHRSALLDPTISWIGIAATGAYWTFNAY